MRRTLAFMLAMASLTAIAADPPPPPPPPPPPAADLPPPPPPPPVDVGEACVPACRAGYACQNGQCVATDAPTTEAEAPPAGATLVNDRGERAPPGQHWESRRKVGLLITGPILFGVGYGLSVLSALSGLSGPRVFSFIPLVGPAISQVLLITSNAYSGFNAGGLFLDLIFTVAVTALQGTGLLLGLLGIPKRQVLVDDPGRRRRDDDDDRREEQPRDNKPPPIQWSLAPFAPGADVGLSLLVRN